MKKLVALCLAAVFATVAFSACGGKKQVEKVVKVGIVVPATQSVAVAMNDKFKEIIESKTDGAIEVQLFPDGVLGGERELYDSVKDGKLEVIVIGSYFYNEVPQILITDFPFLYRSVDHAQAVYNSPEVGGEIARVLEEKTGIKILGWGPNGVRSFSSAKPLEKLADFKGQRIRMPNNKIHIALAKALGANVVILPMGDIFTSLEQKVIDGQDNPLRTLISYGWYEVQKYVFETNHMVASLEILASPQFWASLTPEQQAIVAQAAQEASDYAWDHYKKSISEDEKFLADNGLVVTVPTDDEKAQMQRLVEPIYTDLYKEYPWARDLVAKAKAINVQ
ncbi:MAG: TRAP transporter substrate-binding protein [Elusimicrobiota bacterium]|jgi:tripartite ATP-independent transporter DctP family solute receptor|nr:TRAP transporter substrate-binding protein [Elusimicrobiota bacterium]